MVRFNDKELITTLASDDIMPITDISDSSEDRKVTVEKLSQYTVDNISTLSDGLGLSKNNFTDELKNKLDNINTNDCVHLTGNETITGVKTFIDNPIFKGASWNNQLTAQRDSTASNSFAGIYCKTNNVNYGSIGMSDNGIGAIIDNSGSEKRIVTSTKNIAIGSVSKPVYINANGVATVCNDMQNKLTNGNHITIENDIISVTDDLANTNADNFTLTGKSNIVNYCMPDYAQQIYGEAVSGTLMQVSKDSSVIVWGSDGYAEDYYAFVTDDVNNPYKFAVGRRYDDTTTNTEATTFSFQVPKNWYFTCTAEYGFGYRIFPYKGAN